MKAILKKTARKFFDEENQNTAIAATFNVLGVAAFIGGFWSGSFFILAALSFVVAHICKQ